MRDGRVFFDRYTMSEKWKIQREGFNHIVQGGSADMVKWAMIYIYENNPFGDLLKLILTVHDEIVYLAHKSISEEAAKFIEEKMIKAGKLIVKTIPVKVNQLVLPYWSK